MSDRFQPSNDARRHQSTNLVEPIPLRRQCPLVAEAAERWSVTRLRESLWKGFRGKPRRDTPSDFITQLFSAGREHGSGFAKSCLRETVHRAKKIAHPCNLISGVAVFVGQYHGHGNLW